MLSANGSLMRAQPPTFKQVQVGYTMNPGHAFVDRILSLRKISPLLSETAPRHLVVSAPSIGQNLGALFQDLTNESHKASTGHVRNSVQTHRFETLRRTNCCRDSRNLFTFAATTLFTAQIAAANVNLIHFHAAVEFIPTKAHHSMPKLTLPCPCGFITLQPKNTFQAQGARAVFLVGPRPYCGELRSQEHPWALKDGTGVYRNLAPALPTLKASRCRPGFDFLAALGKFKSIRPSTTREIAASRHSPGNHSKGSWYVSRSGRVFMPVRTIMLGVLASSGCPLLPY